MIAKPLAPFFGLNTIMELLNLRMTSVRRECAIGLIHQAYAAFTSPP